MRAHRRTQIGTVHSVKPSRTLVVRAEQTVLDPRYKKYLTRRLTFYAHDATGECKVGDRVEIAETRPLSRLKRWRLVRRFEG